MVIKIPYSKKHKEHTRQSILQSAYSLFSTKGFRAVTVNKVMENCSLTRGAFYAHFDSKSDLYNESLIFAATHSELSKEKPVHISSKKWLGQLLDEYLSIEHVNGERPCPLAFLATDIDTRNQTAKNAYSRTYKNMNKVIMAYAGKGSGCTKDDVLSLTSMIIGAVAVSRTIEEVSLINDILSSCRQKARQILGGI